MCRRRARGASTVYDVLRDHGVPSGRRRRFTADEVRALVRSYQAGERVVQLAARLAQDPAKVRRGLAQAGVTFTTDRDDRRSPANPRKTRVRARPGEEERVACR